MAIVQSLRRSSVPLYAQIADVMRHRIRRSTWRPDAQLPTLEALAAEFGVARLTIKQAMDALASEGLVVRYRGRGTFVAQVPREEQPLRLETTLDAFWAMYDGTRTRTLTECIAAPALFPGEGTAARSYRCMRRLNSRAGRVLSLATVYLEEGIFASDPGRFRTEPVVSLLLESAQFEIAKARQTLTIGTADVEDADHLGIALNSPTAEVRRVFNDAAGTAFYVAEATYPGDFVRIELDLKSPSSPRSEGG